MDITIVGANGFGNIGDDAYKQLFAEYLPEHNLLFESPSPDEQSIETADYVVFGGGGLLYNNGYSDGIAHQQNMMTYLNWCQKHKKRFSFISVGCQLLESVNEIDAYRPWLDKADLVLVRSKRDVEVLGGKAKYVPDLVYLLKPSTYQIIKPVDTVIAPYRYAKYIGSIHGSFCLLGFSEDDRKYINELGYTGNYLDRIRPTASEASRTIADCKQVICGRYHSLVMALTHKKPFVIIGKQYKMSVEEPPEHISQALENIKQLSEVINGI